MGIQINGLKIWGSNKENDKNRMTAYLSFEEEEMVEDIEPPYEFYFYKNKLGKPVHCRILVRRGNGEIVVENQKGVRVCLMEENLMKIKSE